MGAEPTSDLTPGPKAVRLRGWKEIGRWFGVDERTVKRWEASRGLPVHRVPGEPRAPVFAYEQELRIWVERDKAAPPELLPSTDTDAPPPTERRPWLAVALVLLVLVGAAALWLGQRAAEQGRVADASVADLTRLAGNQVEAVNDQLDSQSGTVAVRAALAKEAVQVLGRVAALPDASAELKRDAAEGYRRLAVLQNAVDRPSQRDRTASMNSLAQALKLLEGDNGPEAAAVRARVQIELSRQAAGGGAPKVAAAMLAASRPDAMQAGGSLRDDWWLGQATVSGWNGDYDASRQAARQVARQAADDPAAALTRLRALDLEAEAAFYLKDVEAARATYGQAVQTATDALARWPADSRLRWNLLRQQWNLGGTLIETGRSRDAVPMLAEALSGWQAVQRADPSDEAVRVWVWVTRLSYGQALAGAGDFARAIPVLSEAVSERRAWHDARLEDADRRRLLMKAQATLADALAPAGRVAEACALYAEAGAMAAEMQAARQLTGYDRRETLRLLAASRDRYC